MTEDRSEHWLWRLDAPAWLRAAEAELDAGAANLAQRRTAVTHARRAAGMALNAVLAAAPPDADELRWGRSYIDHLRALADPTRPIDPLPAAARPLAAALLQIPVLATATTLIPLGRTAESEEMIGPALFLATNDSSYVTGQLFYVDGGWTVQGKIAEASMDSQLKNNRF